MRLAVYLRYIPLKNTNAKDKGITRVIRIHHQGTMHVCTKCVPVRLVAVEIFYRICKKSDLLAALDE